MSREKYLMVKRKRILFQRIAIVLWTLTVGAVLVVFSYKKFFVFDSWFLLMPFLGFCCSVTAQYFLVKEWALEKKYGDHASP